MTHGMKKRKVKQHLVRRSRVFGGYVPIAILNAIDVWISRHPERDRSVFLRESAREKLGREGIAFDESVEVANEKG